MAIGAVSGALAAASVWSTASLDVPCSDVVASVSGARRRVVLGSVSVPPAFLPAPVASDEAGWRHWRKAGISVRAGRARCESRRAHARAALERVRQRRLHALRVGLRPAHVPDR